jgi:ferrous iron transport protein A
LADALPGDICFASANFMDRTLISTCREYFRHAAIRLAISRPPLSRGAAMSAEQASMPLPLATPGKPVRVTAFTQGRDIERRLAGMGVYIGSELRLLQHEGGNVVVAAGHARLALGQGIAQKILVAPAQKTKDAQEKTARN